MQLISSISNKFKNIIIIDSQSLLIENRNRLEFRL